MAIVFTFNKQIEKNETIKFELPNLRYCSSFLSKISLDSNHKEYDIKLIGNDTITSLNESILLIMSEINLLNFTQQIVESSDLFIQVKNLYTKPDKNKATLNLKIVCEYVKLNHNILYSNMINNPSKESMSDICNELYKLNLTKNLSHIVFTFESNVKSISFLPKCTSSPNIITRFDYDNSINLNSQTNDSNSNHNKIIVDLTKDLLRFIKLYDIIYEGDDLNKIGVIIYGI